MSRIARAIGERVRTWAARRHGRDALPARIERRRIYILPTRHGLVLAAMLVAMCVAGLNYGSNLALGFAFLLVALALVAMHHCHRNLLGLCFDAPGDADASAGSDALVGVVLANQAGSRRAAIVVRAGDLGEVRCDVEPRSTNRAVLRIPTARRGVLTADQFELRSDHPFGWFTAWTYLQAPLTVYVAPAPRGARPLPRTAAPNGELGAGTQRGEEEFAGLGAYVPGTPLKHVAWKTLARGGEPAAKRYTGLAGRPQWLSWFDLEPLPGEARLAQLARWVQEAERTGQRYGLRLPHTEIPPAHGAAQRRACLRALARHGLREPR